jgi:hypothetical protein
MVDPGATRDCNCFANFGSKEKLFVWLAQEILTSSFASGGLGLLSNVKECWGEEPNVW